MTNDELPPSPPSPSEPEDAVQPEPVSDDDMSEPDVRPEPAIYAMSRKAWLAAGVGAAVGLIVAGMIVVWGYSQATLDVVHVPGAAADVLGAAFGGQLGQTLESTDTPQLIHLHVQGSMWLVALIVALAVAVVARVLHRDDGESDAAHLWAQAGLAGAALAIVIGLLTLMPSTVGTAGPETITTRVSALPTVVSVFVVGVAGYALGVTRVRRHGGVARLGLRLPSWLRIPAFAVALHVALLAATSTIVTIAYALTTTFDDNSPATAIRLDGVNALITLTGLGGWGHVDPEVAFGRLPEMGTTITPVTGHPIWMMAITLIVAVLAFFVAAITLHLRRPLGRGQWNGTGITLGLYALTGVVLILLASTHGRLEDYRSGGLFVLGDQAYVNPSWWSLITVIVIGLGVECASRFVAPKVLSLMPGIVRRYGKVPGPDVNP